MSMCQSLNLVVVLLQIKICHHTPETFVSLCDMGIPINRGLPYYILSVGKTWFIYILYFVYTQAEQCSVGRIYF